MNAAWRDRLFLVRDQEPEPDPRPSVVHRRFSSGPPERFAKPRELMDWFGISAELWPDVAAQIPSSGWIDGNADQSPLKRSLTEGFIPRSRPGGGSRHRHYLESAVARAIGWHGPLLPSHVLWVRHMLSKPETLAEIEALYLADPDEWVYRCYHGAELVYVGITRSGMNRIRQHIETHEWMKLVTCIEVEHCADRLAAELREGELIARFAPQFNRNPGRQLTELAAEES